jgi:hypothetical protein
MDVYSFLYLTTVFVSFFAGVYVYTKNPGRAVNRVFLFYSMTVSIITFGSYQMGVVSDPERVGLDYFLICGCDFSRQFTYYYLSCTLKKLRIG